MAKIGFIGLGNMGGPMAANLVKAGHEVIGYDLNNASLVTLSDNGGHVATSAAEAAHGADVVITMLPAGEHVREVFLNQGGLIEVTQDAGPLLIDCSTIDVDTARAVAATAEEAGLAMLDAPVSGGTIGALNATLTFMVGGSDAAFERGKPILEAMGKNIFHAGGPGAGQGGRSATTRCWRSTRSAGPRASFSPRSWDWTGPSCTRSARPRPRTPGRCQAIVRHPERWGRRRPVGTTRQVSWRR